MTSDCPTESLNPNCNEGHEPFSERLLAQIVPVLKGTLSLHGLDVQEVHLSEIEEDDNLLALWGSELTITIVAKTSGPRP